LGIRLKKTCSSLTTVPEFVWINGTYPWKFNVFHPEVFDTYIINNNVQSNVMGSHDVF